MRALLAIVFALLSARVAHAGPVLMISIDGLRPLDVVEADRRGFTVPNLRAIMAAGAYATGVRNSLPTVTYPNHTTLITGVWPERHGIANNTTFDPTGSNQEGWYWYAPSIRVPTLWDTVHAAGGTVASVGWPVSVDARSIDLDIPEYWRARNAEDLKLLHALATPGLPEALERESGVSLAQYFGETVEADEAKAKMAAALYRLYRPRFFTLHLSSLDHVEHATGPGSDLDRATLARIDAAIGTILAAARAVEPDLDVLVVSDHGFAPVEHAVNLIGAFAEAGLITLDPATGKVKAWDAAPWGGASAAVVLRDPGDAAVKAKVRALLDRLSADPRAGINRVADSAEVARMGGSAEAAFWIDFKTGYAAGGRATGPLVQPSTQRGTHGYFPDDPEMRASFFAAGPDVPRRGVMGEIDQRDIAPTAAKLLRVTFPSADGKPLF